MNSSSSLGMKSAWVMLLSSVIKTATQTLRGVNGFFIQQWSSLAGLSGPVHGMITALIKDRLGLCKSQDSSCEQGEELTEHAAMIHTVCTICL